MGMMPSHGLRYPGLSAVGSSAAGLATSLAGPTAATAIGATAQKWLSLLSATTVTGEVATPLYLSKGGTFVIPQMFGGIDDAVIYAGAGSIAAGGTTVTFSSPHGLTTADIGKVLVIDEVGSTAKDLWTTLTADGDGASHHVTLAKAATRTVSAQNGVFYAADLSSGVARSATMSMTAGSAVLTDTAGNYVAGNASQEIVVEQAINARHTATITAVPTASTVTISAAATVAGSAKTVVVGTDNKAIIASAITAADTLGLPLYLPKTRTGLYFCNLDGISGGTSIWDNTSCSVGRDSNVRIVVNNPYTAALIGFRVVGGTNLIFDIDCYDPFFENSMMGIGATSRTSGLQVLYLVATASNIRNCRAKVKTVGCYAPVYVAEPATYRTQGLDVDIHAEWCGYGLAAQQGFNITGRVYAKRFERIVFLNAYDTMSNIDLNVTAEQARVGDGFVSIDLGLPDIYDMQNVKIKATWLDKTCADAFAIRSQSNSTVYHRNIELNYAGPQGSTKPALLIFMQPSPAVTGVYTTSGAMNLHRMEGVRTNGLAGISLFGYSQFPIVVTQQPEDIAEARLNFNLDAWADGQVWLASPDGTIWSWGAGNSTLNRTSWKFPVRVANGFLTPVTVELEFLTIIASLATPDYLNTKHHVKCYRSGAGTSSGIAQLDEMYFAYVNTNNAATKPTFGATYPLTYIMAISHVGWNHTSAARALVAVRPRGYGARAP